jgi:hypothetical protein
MTTVQTLSDADEAQDPRTILAVLIQRNDEIDMVELGRIEQDRRCGRPLSPEEKAAWDWIAAQPGGGPCLLAAGRLYEEHLEQVVRQHGGSIIRERHGWRNGRRTVTRTFQRFPEPVTKFRGRAMPRARGAGRRGARAARRAAGIRAGTDPGDDGPGEPEPPPKPTRRELREWLTEKLRELAALPPEVRP